MVKKAHTDVWGTSTQTAADYTLSKSNLVSQGLTATTTNTVQSILNAILKRLSVVFTAPNRVTNTDETMVVSYAGQTTRTEGVNVYRVDTYRVEFYKLTPDVPPNPNDY